jgi:hypothetical protein
VTPLHRVFIAAIGTTLLAIVVGLVARGRWRLIWSFVAYLAVGVCVDFLLTFWPSRFWIRPFWLAEQTLAHVLALGIALEVGWQTFRVFPGADSAARRIAVVLLGGTAFMLIAVPISGVGFDPFLTAVAEFYPRLDTGTMWMMIGILALARWYHVPVHPFHAAVLASLAISLGISGLLVTLLGRYGYEGLVLDLSILDGLAFLLLSIWWAHVAWRPRSETEVRHDRTLSELEARFLSVRPEPSVRVGPVTSP